MGGSPVDLVVGGHATLPGTNHDALRGAGERHAVAGDVVAPRLHDGAAPADRTQGEVGEAAVVGEDLHHARIARTAEADEEPLPVAEAVGQPVVAEGLPLATDRRLLGELPAGHGVAFGCRSRRSWAAHHCQSQGGTDESNCDLTEHDAPPHKISAIARCDDY